MSPINSDYFFHFPYPLNLEKIKEAKNLMIGTKDFTGFSNAKKINNPKKTIFDIKIVKNKNIIKFSILGDSFLYKMVRTIVGTLLYIGKDKIDFKDISNIFKTKKRSLAGITAPSNGLFLKKIYY